MHWDPSKTPDADAWLALDESERKARIEVWHQANPTPELHGGGNPSVHAHLHAIVENQIAVGEPTATGTAVARLMEAGLHRHVALHAVMRVLVLQMSQAMAGGGFDDDAYTAELDALDAATVLHRALGG